MSVVMEDYSIPPSPEASSLAVVDAVGLKGSDLALSLLEQSEDCIKLLSVDGNLEFMNCGGLGAMEIDRPEMVLGKLWWALWPAESQSFVRDQFQSVLQGRTVAFEAHCPTAKGNERFWSVNLKPLCARDGPVVSVLATSRELPMPEERQATAA